jgi:bacillithiol system protein YtxJ
MLKNRIVSLTTPEDVQDFLAHHPTSVIFKAGTCHKTMQGFGFLQEKLEDREDLMVGVIRVIEQRPASNYVAERTGIVHHSPQVILFRDGEAVFDVDNWAITPEALEEGFVHVPHDPSGGAVGRAHMDSDLTPYKRLLERYLAGEMSDAEFEYTYTTLFRDDASLRSKEEVEILNSIFGDVDKHLEMHLMMGGRTTDHEAVRERAKRAYEALQKLEGVEA